MSADPVAQLLSDPRFRGQPITWGVTPEGYAPPMGFPWVPEAGKFKGEVIYSIRRLNV